MFKTLILLSLVLVAMGCGKTSKIKTHVEGRALGDGENITFNIVVPLSEKSISSFQSPVKNVMPVFKGITESLMNIGAAIGAGKQRLTLTQPIPEIPEDYVSSLKIKRIFFYIESLDKEDGWFKKFKREEFDFLRRLVVKISSTKMPRDAEVWEPKIETGSLKGSDLNFFEGLFKKKRDMQAENFEKESTGLLMIQYNQEQPKESLQSELFGTVHIIETETPNSTRKYLEKNYGKYFKRIHTLSKSILVELKKDPVLEETFKMKFAADAEKMEDLGIGEINPCNNKVCLDLKLKDLNLIPIINKGNAIKIDTYIDPKYTPKSFQLKGFIEFEVKIKSTL